VTVDDVVRAVLITLGVLVVAGLALIAFLMWRFKIPPRGELTVTRRY
jgi:formate-dependent nitrite reductase membrane component NrfD